MTNSSKPPTRFGLETCQDMYDKLKLEAQRLEDGWSVCDTFNFVVTAHHLYKDWIDNCGSPEAKAKKCSLPEPAKMVMQSIVDLANGNKHWQMTNKRSLERQVVKKVHERIVGDWYAYLVAGQMVYVDFGDYRLSYSGTSNGYSKTVTSPFRWSYKTNLSCVGFAQKRNTDLSGKVGMTSCKCPKTVCGLNAISGYSGDIVPISDLDGNRRKKELLRTKERF